MTPLTPADVDPAHIDAVRRRRRIIAHCDANLPGELLGIDLTEWLDYRFEYLDAAGSCVDTVVWDMGQIEAEEPVRVMRSGVWTEQGIDVLDALVRESRRRGKEVFWSHRISEVDLTPDGTLALDPQAANPAKAGHPERVVRCWWWQGLWNLCSDWVKAHKVAVLRDVLGRYAFDGLQIDFSRYVPCLPAGREWEHRQHVTAFLCMVRAMLREEAARRGSPRLLAVKVPRSVAGCRLDGFDVAAWVDQGLVDLIVPGCRSLDVDVQGFVELAGGRDVPVYPCLDDHHGTDAYLNPGPELFRGVFVNWLSQGAAGAQTFNWTHASAATHARLGVRSLPAVPSHPALYQEAGSLETLRRYHRLHAVERRGGFRWTGGFFCSNRDAALPVELPHSGEPVAIPLPIHEDLTDPRSASRVELRIVLFNAQQGDRYQVAVNGAELTLTDSTYRFRDAQIYSPDPQPPVGWEPIVDRPDQRLARLVYALPAQHVVVGSNRVTVAIEARMPYVADRVQVEKVEALVIAPA